MDLSVCVCTHDRPAYARDCLKGLRAQTVPASRFEVLLVDSGSTGAVPDALRDLAACYDARLVRLDRPGLSAARNAGAAAARADHIAYIDDDAIPAPDWVEAILRALAAHGAPPALLGGRILPEWEAPLPAWWPASLRGVLSIIEHQGRGAFRSPPLPRTLEPYGANMVVHIPSLRAVGGFAEDAGRRGSVMLSDEDVRVAWLLQNAGLSCLYDPTIVVWHRIQASRLRPEWLLSRLFWQGASTVMTRRLTGQADMVWRELPRRCLVALLYAPFSLVPARSSRWMGPRWRRAYATGFILAALGWSPGRTGQAATGHRSGTLARPVVRPQEAGPAKPPSPLPVRMMNAPAPADDIAA